jgi:hypothetical protein
MSNTDLPWTRQEPPASPASFKGNMLDSHTVTFAKHRHFSIIGSFTIIGVIHAIGTLTERQMYKVKTPKIELKSETPKLL